MEVVLRKSTVIQGHVEIVEVDGDSSKVPSKRTFESEEAAINAIAQYLGVLTSELDRVTYEL